MAYKITYEGSFGVGLKMTEVMSDSIENAKIRFQKLFPGVQEPNIKSVISISESPSVREMRKQKNAQFDTDILNVLSDGRPHCLRDIGEVIGYSYITGLSARVRGLRKALPDGQALKLYKVGTPEESTWYILEKTASSETASQLGD